MEYIFYFSYTCLISAMLKFDAFDIFHNERINSDVNKCQI
jgi:hypothetical protein